MRLLALLPFSLLLSNALPQLGTPVSYSGGAGATPAIIQHVVTTANWAGYGAPNGNDFRLYLAPTGAGDALVFTITGLHSHALTITDSAGDTSPTAICSADNGATNGLSYLYAFYPSTGVTWVQAAASGTFAQPVDMQATEFNNIASVTAQGDECQAGLPSTSGTVTPTSFTPTNNNATGGNLIYNYTAVATGTNQTSCTASSYTPASGFTLLNGDVSSTINGDGLGFQKSAQYEIQTTTGAVSASVAMAGETCNSGNGDPFNSLTVALKIGTAGISTPLTIHVVRVIQLTTSAYGGPTRPTAFVVPTPTAGNLRVFEFEGAPTDGWANPSTVVTSSDGCNYTHVAAGSNQDLVFYAQGCMPCPTCTATFTNTGSPTLDNTVGQFYDVENANASSYQNSADSNPSCNSVTTTTTPTLTPANSVGLSIGMLGNGQGPTTGLTSPSGVVYTCPTWSGQYDGDLMCSGDGHGYELYSSNAAQSWTWKITSISSNTCAGMASAFE